MTKVDVHNYEGRLRIALKKLEGSKIEAANKKDIMDFYRYSLAKGISGPRMAKYLYNLILAAELLGKPFTEASKDDLVELVNQILEKDWSNHTKHDFNVILKRFYKWLEGGDEEYPKKVKWITTTLKYDNKKLPEELLTKEEVIDMIEIAYHMRDKALICVLYESGCRIGEVLSLRIKHVTIDDMGGQIIVDGKTGMRRIRLIVSVPYLTTWLDHHPLKNDPEAPLWPILATRNRNGFLSYQSANTLIQDIAKKAGIKKKANPHIFRHSRATHLANTLTEAQMNHYFGWIQGSKMPSTYVHLSGRDLDDAILRMNGIKKKEELKDEDFAPKECQRCKETNPPTAKFCKRCGSPMSQQAVIQFEDQRKRWDNLMAYLLKDPVIRTAVVNKMREMRNGGPDSRI